MSSLLTHTNTKRLYNAHHAMPLLVIDNEQCYAVISLCGGQILEYQQKGKEPLLWLSPKAIFEPGTPIRGGIPLCAPWFGPHDNSDYPKHGFARTSLWQLIDSHNTATGHISITLELVSSEHTQVFYPYDFSMQLTFILGDNLAMEFSVKNKGSADMPCAWALHSYFKILNIAHTQVTGLAGQSYVDKLVSAEHAAKILEGALTFTREVDNYFLNTNSAQHIEQHSEQQTTIIITGENCPSVITWNPAQQLASKMKDIGVDNYPHFVCVERGAIFDDTWLISPGEQQVASLSFNQ